VLRVEVSGFRIQDSGFRIQDSGFRIQYEHGDGNAGSSMQRARNPGYLMGCVLRDIFLRTVILNPEP
jgi:hypothetical protein